MAFTDDVIYLLQIFKSHGAATTVSRSARVLCTAQIEPRRIAGAALGAAAAVSLFFSAIPSAEAVSGGGGVGNSLAFKDLSGQDLRGKKYIKADLRGINLEKADLTGSSLFGALLIDAKMAGANLTNADLESTDLQGADLHDAVLAGAMLTNAQMMRISNIDNTDWSDALIRPDIAKSLCKIAKGTNPTTGVDTRESLNCP
jgi:uncharacterized protein YjbI with pentapeptide repeats